MKIFCDMDGVIVNFMKPVMAIFEKPEFLDGQWPTGKGLYGALGVDKEWFWHVIELQGPFFWEELEFYPWALEFIKTLKEIGDELIFITAPPQIPGKWWGHGRVSWIFDNFDDPDFILTNRKELFAGEGRVLIDDFDGNVDRWNEAGGSAFLFGRPWNSANADDADGGAECQRIVKELLSLKQK